MQASRPQCGLYGAPPCLYVPAPPGQTPACAKPGKTYCENVPQYPKYETPCVIRLIHNSDQQSNAIAFPKDASCTICCTGTATTSPSCWWTKRPILSVRHYSKIQPFSGRISPTRIANPINRRRSRRTPPLSRRRATIRRLAMRIRIPIVCSSSSSSIRATITVRRAASPIIFTRRAIRYTFRNRGL